MSTDAIEVPLVTEDDLRLFHGTHFASLESVPSGTSLTVNAEAEEKDDDDDDGLGYYPDGVKRTLTDEQIAMFRHSEIQSLLRERRIQRENADADTTPVPLKASPGPSHGARSTSRDESEQRRSTSTSESLESRKRKWQRFIETSKSNPDHLTHRRIARELDEQKASSIDLAYGDEVSSNVGLFKRPKTTTPLSEGRKQISYGDSDDGDTAEGPMQDRSQPARFLWPTLGATEPM